MNYYDEDRIQDLKEELGDEFLSENNYDIPIAYPMESFDEIMESLKLSPKACVDKAFFGKEWEEHDREHKLPFNPNHKYFTFDSGYGNLCSIPEELIDVFESKRFDDINDEDFFDWLENVHPEYLED